VDLPCNAGPDALRHAALRAAESVAPSEHSEAEHVLTNFFELSIKDSMCCYGETQTLKALETGAVEHLLITQGVETRLGADGLRTLAASYGTRVVEICPRTEQGTKFCESFCVGACLRWPLDLEFLEEDDDALPEEARIDISVVQSVDRLNALCGHEAFEASNCTAPLLESRACEDHEAFAEVELISMSTTDTANLEDVSQQHGETLEWFKAELTGVIGDSSAAEAITACLEVVLCDEVSSREEIAESILAVASAEGVPEELASELMRRW